VEPFQITLASTLQAVLVSGERVEETRQMGDSRIQLIRFHAGNETYARLVRIVIEVSGQMPWRIIPAKASDEIRLDRYVRDGCSMSVRLERGEDVNAEALPDLSAFDVLLEVFG